MALWVSGFSAVPDRKHPSRSQRRHLCFGKKIRTALTTFKMIHLKPQKLIWAGSKVAVAG
jgi:hypothetical protein